MSNPSIFEVVQKLKPSYKYIDYRVSFYIENGQRKHYYILNETYVKLSYWSVVKIKNFLISLY